MRKSLYKPDNLITPLIKEALKVIPLKLFSRTLIFFLKSTWKQTGLLKWNVSSFPVNLIPPALLPKAAELDSPSFSQLTDEAKSWLRNREGWGVNVQSFMALLMKSWRKILLTLPQIPFLALHSGDSGKLLTLCGNQFVADSFGFQATETNVRNATTFYPDGLAQTLFLLIFLMPNSSCLPIQGNTMSQVCEVRWFCPGCETPARLLVGSEPSPLRTSSGGLTEVQRNLEWQETAISFEPEKGWISVLKHFS